MEKPHRRKKQLPPSQEEIIEGSAYTIGVLLRYGNQVLVDRRTGYALVTDAAELLIAATQAFKTQERASTVCTFPVVDVDSGQKYPALNMLLSVFLALF